MLKTLKQQLTATLEDAPETTDPLGTYLAQGELTEIMPNGQELKLKITISSRMAREFIRVVENLERYPASREYIRLDQAFNVDVWLTYPPSEQGGEK